MRYTTATLAALTLVALVAGGVSAAPTAPSTAASADVEQPANYTTGTVDPDDELTDSDVETARELAWANDSVRAAVDTDAPVAFEVRAPDGDDDHVSVGLDQHGTTVATADVDLDAESVVGVDEPEVLSTTEADHIEFEPIDESSAETAFEVTTDSGSNPDVIRVATDGR